MSKKKEAVAPELTFREKLAAAKEKDWSARSFEVSAFEIEEDLKLHITALQSSDYKQVIDLYRKGEAEENEALKKFSLIIMVAKDKDGNLCFTEDDVEFLDSLGHRFYSRLVTPANHFSGIGEDFRVLKKTS